MCCCAIFAGPETSAKAFLCNLVREVAESLKLQTDRTSICCCCNISARNRTYSIFLFFLAEKNGSGYSPLFALHHLSAAFFSSREKRIRRVISRPNRDAVVSYKKPNKVTNRRVRYLASPFLAQLTDFTLRRPCHTHTHSASKSPSHKSSSQPKGHMHGARR